MKFEIQKEVSALFNLSIDCDSGDLIIEVNGVIIMWVDSKFGRVHFAMLNEFDKVKLQSLGFIFDSQNRLIKVEN